uniref:CBL-interacting serine/threonine-protein kinase n=1 Tax=Solanum tuberosum TaxID=4113 RepID=M1C2R0_SOLTU
MRLQNLKAGRKGNLNVSTEVFQVAPSLHMVEVRKSKGDTLEFHKVHVVLLSLRLLVGVNRRFDSYNHKQPQEIGLM